MASTLVTFDAFLKERYTDWKVEDLTQGDNTFLGQVAKDEGFSGDGQPHPLIYGNPQGIAGVFSTSQGNESNVKGKKFLLTSGDYFGTVRIGDKVLKQSRNNAGGFLQNKVTEIDGLYAQMAEDMEGFCFGNSGGSIGRRASIATNTITLSEPSDVQNFHVDEYIVASANDGSDTGHTVRTGRCRVTVLDQENGKITVDSAAGITGFADNDYLFREGTFRGNTGIFIIAGLGSFIWNDNAPPTLYSMVRTDDLFKLAGVRVKSSDLTGKNIEERLRLLGVYMTGRAGGKGSDKVFLNPEDWQNLGTSLEQKGQRSLTDDSTRFGYEYFEAVLGGKRNKIYQSRKCPRGTAFAVNMPTWKLFSTGKLFHTQNEDGLDMLRRSDSTDYEMRVISYPVLATNAPGYNGRVPLPT